MARLGSPDILAAAKELQTLPEGHLACSIYVDTMPEVTLVRINPGPIRPETWVCANCHASNSDDRMACHVCGWPRGSNS